METLMIFLIVFVSGTLATSAETERLVNHPGHLKPLGFGRPTQDVEQYEGFPSSKWFFENYVHDTKPLFMKNAAKVSKAYTQWTDEYFLQQDEPLDHTVTVELKKKENRTFGAENYSFKKFVRIYNESDIYMVNNVPPFIQSDVMLPGPLQCQQMMDEILVDCVMWFSSGGTKSVVHTDSVENINCLFRGQKELLFVDPTAYGDKVDIDHPEGAYSDIDVDRVDFTKYPGMADVEYYRVWMEPGDCLYIPHKWIHQVRSYGSNIAVNVWWDRYAGLEIDLDQCPEEYDTDLTMDKVELRGLDENIMTIPAMIDHFLDHTQKSGIDLDKAVTMLVGDTKEIDQMDSSKSYMKIIRKIFLLLDVDRNGKIESDEVEDTEDEAWEEIMELMQEFDNMYQQLEARWREVNGEVLRDPNERPRSAYDHGGEL